MARRGLDTVSLADALRLAPLIGEFEPERWPRATARWHARFVLEVRRSIFDEAALALAAVRALTGPHRELAAKTLRRLVSCYGMSLVAAPLRAAALSGVDSSTAERGSLRMEALRLRRVR
jgi:hypothetical protein